MTNIIDQHIPVLADRIVNQLKNDGSQIILDGTFGMGGLTKKILTEIPTSTVTALDRDPDAIAHAQSMEKRCAGRLKPVHGCFSQISKLIDTVFDAAIFDCGVSSPQLDKSERGFSFQRNGPLDMRMSQSGLSAQEIINTWSADDLTHIFKQWGEERFSKKIANSIFARRKKKLFTETMDLANFIASLVPQPKNGTHPATRTFQGLRMAVNNELCEIEQAVHQTLPLLKDGGVLMVVTFHSLEHRCAKQALEFYAKEQENIIVSRYLPPQEVKQSDRNFYITGFKKCVKPSEIEIKQNIRARSAQMRICYKHKKQR